MAVNVVLNGVSYSIPDPGDTAWGQDLTDYMVAQASGLLQKAGGLFTLTAEVDFGNTYGVKSIYFKSRATNPASSGQVRLGNTEAVSWRNAANSANLSLSVDASDNLTFNGSAIQPAGNYITALTGDVTATGPGSVVATIAAGVIVNSMVSASAAIAYSKLALTGSIVNADVSASAAIAYSKLALTGSIVNADISASAAIAYSKLALTGSIVNADVSASAAIAFSKLASLTSANILVGSGSNIATAVAVTGDISLSNAGVTAYSGTVPLNKGGTGQTTKAAAFDALSPMSASGDMVYGGASGTGTRLAKGSDGQVLTLASGLPSWANVGAATAPTVQKFLSTGTTTGYLFTISSASVTAGATYTNNGNTYTALNVLSSQSGQVLFMSGASAPTASGTLTKASGFGDATITFSANTALATYTRPTGPTPLYIRVRLVGGGGGGASTTGSGTAGTATVFGSNVLIGNGSSAASPGTSSSEGGDGGTATINSPAYGTAVRGGKGGYPATSTSTNSQMGGMGAASFFGGAGVGGMLTAGTAAATNSGSGGGGGASNGTNGAGGGGGAGGFVDAIIPSPSATYVYAIGANGVGGSTGQQGGNGAAGYIEVTEYYQ